MDKYVVVSGRVSGHQAGEVLTSDDLDGSDIDALLAAGHLKHEKAAAAKKEMTK